MKKEFMIDVISEFKELKEQIEGMQYDELDDVYCTLTESDGYKEMDVCDDGDSLIWAVYVDRTEDGGCSVSADNVTVHMPDGKNVTMYLEKIN